MDQLKKNVFWIILAVVVIGALATWYSLMPDLELARSDALANAARLRTASQAALRPNGLPTAAHRKAAEEYAKRLDTEKKTLIDTLQQWPDFSVKRLNAHYSEAPAGSKPIEFDNWMDAQRKRLSKKLTEAGILYSQAEFDRILFNGVNIDTALSSRPVDINKPLNSVRHRDYQLRILAIMDEVVDALVPRTGSIPISKFETDPAKPEPVDSAPTGALRFESFVFHTPEETEKNSDKAYELALTKSGWKREARPAEGFKGAELPVTVTSVDIEFVAHDSALPAIIRKLEGSDRYLAVVTKADSERASPLYPGPLADTKVQQDYAKAAFNPLLNTHYGEGPVKAFVTLEFYEYDKAKADKLDAPPVAPPLKKAPAPATAPR